jgi:DNA polymerase/3'-5' exonuclease PolX
VKEDGVKNEDAMTMAEAFVDWLADNCEGDAQGEPMIVIAGGIRRQKPEVHDLDIVAQPILKAPALAFGQKPYATFFDKTLGQLQADGYLLETIADGPKKKKYEVNVQRFGIQPDADPFCVEFNLVTPPAQFGVLLMIRTGPGSDLNNFSQWIVTPRAKGGALPDGYRVKHGAVWLAGQLDAKDQPLRGERPLEMAGEAAFFNFLEMDYVRPEERKAKWRRDV